MKKNKSAPDKREKLWAEFDAIEDKLKNVEHWLNDAFAREEELKKSIEKQLCLAKQYRANMNNIAFKIQSEP